MFVLSRRITNQYLGKILCETENELSPDLHSSWFHLITCIHPTTNNEIHEKDIDDVKFLDYCIVHRCLSVIY